MRLRRPVSQPAYSFANPNPNSNLTLWPPADSWDDGRGNRYRHASTSYFLPNFDEWYKAAYYNPDEDPPAYNQYP